jgi:hypothetical protein
MRTLHGICPVRDRPALPADCAGRDWARRCAGLQRRANRSGQGPAPTLPHPVRPGPAPAIFTGVALSSSSKASRFSIVVSIHSRSVGVKARDNVLRFMTAPPCWAMRSMSRANTSIARSSNVEALCTRALMVRSASDAAGKHKMRSAARQAHSFVQAIVALS